MFRKMEMEPKDFRPYREVVPRHILEGLDGVLNTLKAERIVHVNSTPMGGGVAEILRSLLPLSKGLGIDTDWFVITPPESFFKVTKKIHNLMQGAEGELTRNEEDEYFSYGGTLGDFDVSTIEADVVFLHDPQLLPLMQVLPKKNRPMVVWVCHIDLSKPNVKMLRKLIPYISLADKLVFSLQQYVPSGLAEESVNIIPPAIDPLSDKNRYMDLQQARDVVASMGVDVERPFITQVSRFDPWKDPRGVVDVYRIAKRAIPELQLAYLGASHATDDPEGASIYADLEQYIANDRDVHLYTEEHISIEMVDTVVNAFQKASPVILQKSLREGFGLTITEAMWKQTPVIGSNVGGITIQIVDGETGFLVANKSQCAKRAVELLASLDKRIVMGEKAKESVRQKFLLPRFLRDYIKVGLQ